jgi:hypothetical protein
MRVSLHFLALALCAVWLLLAAAPTGLRICLQNSGKIQTGLGCSCQAWPTSEAEQAVPACGVCCDQDGSAGPAGKPCCTCLNLALVVVAPLVKLDPPQLVSTTGGLHALAQRMPVAGPVPLRAVEFSHLPPWRTGVILRL